MHRLAWKWNTLPCALSILNHRISAEVCLLGHSGFQEVLPWGRFSAINIHKAKRFIGPYSRNEGRLANRFFPEKRSLDVSLGPYRATSVSKIPTPPPPKKIAFFSDWASLFEICFRSSEMTDPRPCPRAWAYFRVPSCSMETCQAQTNSK